MRRNRQIQRRTRLWPLGRYVRIAVTALLSVSPFVAIGTGTRAAPATSVSSAVAPPPEAGIAPRMADSAPSAGMISITGQVRHPGSYPLQPGERLAEALVRAGGLTDFAYPYGAVFIRKSLVEQERATDAVIARRLLRACSGDAPDDCTSSGDAKAPSAISGIAGSAIPNNTLGRISVIADPSVLVANPGQDLLLEPGDSIDIPQRPDTVMVTGAVAKPGNYPYTLDATLSDYLDQAGGYGASAREGSIIVIYPDGRARSVVRDWLYFRHSAIPPGSVVFVPAS